MTELRVAKDLDKREAVLERELPASAALVWEAWTTAEHLEAWWGPRGWTTTVRSLDVRPGGLWHFGMRAEGTDDPPVWIRAVYSEVIPGLSLTYVEGFSDESGADLDPDSQSVTVDFFELDPGRTRLVLRFRFSTDARLRQITAMGMVEGYSTAFDRLDEHLTDPHPGRTP